MSHILKVLIAYDDSTTARAMLSNLRLAGLGTVVEARVMTVSDPWIPPIESLSVGTDVLFGGAYAVASEYTDDVMVKAKTLATKAGAQLKKHFPNWTVSTATALNAPAQGILEHVDSWKPDLIVLGSKGHTFLKRVLLGSVSHNVLKHTFRSIRIVRPSHARADAAPRVLLAVDGSKNAVAMVKQVASRSWEKNAEFCVISVLDYPLSLIENSSPLINGNPRGATPQNLPALIAEEATCVLAERGFKVTSAIREGDPRVEILKEIKRFKANNLFLGRQGLHAAERLFLGSVSSSLAEHSPCTVEVVGIPKK